MVQYARTGVDASFAALSNATRRGVLEQLGRAAKVGRVQTCKLGCAGWSKRRHGREVPAALGRTLR
jgi:hypothetical protein